MFRSRYHVGWIDDASQQCVYKLMWNVQTPHVQSQELVTLALPGTLVRGPARRRGRPSSPTPLVRYHAAGWYQQCRATPHELIATSVLGYILFLLTSSSILGTSELAEVSSCWKQVPNTIVSALTLALFIPRTSRSFKSKSFDVRFVHNKWIYCEHVQVQGSMMATSGQRSWYPPLSAFFPIPTFETSSAPTGPAFLTTKCFKPPPATIRRPRTETIRQKERCIACTGFFGEEERKS